MYEMTLILHCEIILNLYQYPNFKQRFFKSCRGRYSDNKIYQIKSFINRILFNKINTTQQLLMPFDGQTRESGYIP